MTARTENALVGQRIAALRGKRSQAAIAEAMRTKYGWPWSQMTVWSLESGKRHLRFTEARDLARVLHVGVMELFGEEPEPFPKTLHTSPDAEERAECAADNPALATESVAKAEHRAAQGWPWPVSGDATTILQPGKIPWGVKRKGRLK